jgi:hypothetical protein
MMKRNRFYVLLRPLESSDKKTFGLRRFADFSSVASSAPTSAVILP